MVEVDSGNQKLKRWRAGGERERKAKERGSASLNTKILNYAIIIKGKT